MASKEPAPVDQEELQNLEKLWVNFGAWSKWGIGFVIVVLVGLAIGTL
ncbi:MAG: hypothetical protein GW778_07840 [Alphaproteobacteria bacterium]|nr:hypothetical protein [Alphaproteobacteria bacterium]